MEQTESTDIFEKLAERLKSRGINFDVLNHAAAFTSEESAKLRGVNLHTGAKALIVKADTDFMMIVLPADFYLDSNSTKKILNCKKLRFANKEEVEQLTQLQPGSIPPFGSLFQLKTYCDSHLSENNKIYFNAGMHTRSIGLIYTDYVLFENPVIDNFGVIKI
jgi:Ala-tRNA(Pro) deacylase